MANITICSLWMYHIILIQNACVALFNEGLVKQPFNRGPAPTKSEFTHLTCICCYLSSSKRPRPASEAGNRRWKAGVFYQRAAGGAERSDETDPSSASPAGCNRGPGNEARGCSLISFALCSHKIAPVVFSPDPQRILRSTFGPLCVLFPHLMGDNTVGHFGNYYALVGFLGASVKRYSRYTRSLIHFKKCYK